ncbi:MAG: long-chain fatty acid--CoA ligase [Firmicutes bacterium]|nr:long-chain fatty acid--CoA ligase [Bacillota bacterium]MBE3590466.1 long-chain fatty acid--CoA ligase [Bacillota bacterium]
MTAAGAPLPPEGRRLEAEILAWVREYERAGPAEDPAVAAPAGMAPARTAPSRKAAALAVDAAQAAAARFDELARRVFAYQFVHNPHYRRFCERRGIAPPLAAGDGSAGAAGDRHAGAAGDGSARRAPAGWLDIPAVPAAALKDAALATFDVHRAAAVFETSGTTQGRPGRHHLPHTTLYEAALTAHFRHYVLPDLAEGERLPVFVLFPDLPRSSLAHMMRTVIARFGAPESRFFLREAVREAALDVDGLVEALERASAAGRPVLLAGAVLGFVFACEALAARGRRFRLPAGSRIMDTGGFKGRRREIARDELRRMYAETFGVPPDLVVNEYGMTELASQFYDARLRRALALRGAPAGAAPAAAAEEDGRLRPPPWMRAAAVDPDTLRPLPPGERGLLRVVDLCNLHTVPFLQLEDVGRVDAHGRVTLEGRAHGAELRGCSLAVEDLLAAGGAVADLADLEEGRE